MTPSIQVRLESVLHGLRDVIVPAINPNEALALEQIGLIVAQLDMLVRQYPYADRFNRLCRDDARATAAEIVRAPQGGPRSLAAAAALARQLQIANDDPHADYIAIAEGIATLTTAACEDAGPEWRARLDGAVLAFVCRQNRRERVWVKDAGFDPDPAELPDLAMLCSPACAPAQA